MATKTFSDGTLLTASDLNTYCANPSLTVIGSGSFTSASTFDVTGFTSSYYAYRLLIHLTTSSASGQLRATVLSGATNYTTGYYGTGFYVTYTSSFNVDGAINNGAYFVIGRHVINGNCSMVIDITGMADATVYPMSATQNFFDATLLGQRTYCGHRAVGGISYDGLRVVPSSGTTTGKWVLSAYRKGDS